MNHMSPIPCMTTHIKTPLRLVLLALLCVVGMWVFIYLFEIIPAHYFAWYTSEGGIRILDSKTLNTAGDFWTVAAVVVAMTSLNSYTAAIYGNWYSNTLADPKTHRDAMGSHRDYPIYIATALYSVVLSLSSVLIWLSISSFYLFMVRTATSVGISFVATSTFLNEKKRRLANRNSTEDIENNFTPADMPFHGVSTSYSYPPHNAAKPKQRVPAGEQLRW